MLKYYKFENWAWFFVSLVIVVCLAFCIKPSVKYKLISLSELEEKENLTSLVIYNYMGDENPEKKGGFLKIKDMKAVYFIKDKENIGELLSIIKTSEVNLEELDNKNISYLCFEEGKNYICIKANINEEERTITGEGWKSTESYEYLENNFYKSK